VATAIGTLAAWRCSATAPGYTPPSPLCIFSHHPGGRDGIALLAAQAGVRLGLTTITLAHIAFCVPFVTPVVLRLTVDKSIEEAAMDLGQMTDDLLASPCRPSCLASSPEPAGLHLSG
jgi:ABC-type spermidine/putrescine transport system permease subunit II